jgi:tRNA nucleotidyltransferase/poly(A) polymerase
MDDLITRCARLIQPQESPAYLVGGSVRDQLLGRVIHDVDLAVSSGALAIARRLADALGGAFFPLDVERQIGRVVMSDQTVIDVAQLRGPDIATDLAARDFTINAMARPLDNLAVLIDPRHGADDVQARIIRAASERAFATDPARLLRAVRLAVELGFSIDPSTLVWLERDTPLLASVAGERLRDELLRLVQQPDVAGGLLYLANSGMLAQILPHALVDTKRLRVIANLAELCTRFEQRPQPSAVPAANGLTIEHTLSTYADLLGADLTIDIPGGRTSALIARLSLVYDDAASAATDLSRLRFQRDEIQYMRALVGNRNRLEQVRIPVDALSAHRFFRDSGARAGRMGLLVIALARTLGEHETASTIDKASALLKIYSEAYDRVIAPRPLLSGAELAKRFGLRGKSIGLALLLLIEAQVAGRVHSASDAEVYLAESKGF